MTPGLISIACNIRRTVHVVNGPFARYAKLRVAHAPGMPGTFSPPPRVSDPDMHHDTCVTHVPWCMPGSLISGFIWSRWRENVTGIPGTAPNFTYLVRGPWRRILLEPACRHVPFPGHVYWASSGLRRVSFRRLNCSWFRIAQTINVSQYFLCETIRGSLCVFMCQRAGFIF